MKLWKVLARNSYIYNANSNGPEMHEMKCRSPTWSEDSGKHSAPSVQSEPNTNRPIYHTTVELHKMKGEDPGIIFTPQGPSDSSCPIILALRPGSAASRSDVLAPGDRIRSVNGLTTSRARLTDPADLTLDLEYSLPDYSSQNSLCVQTKIATVTLERENGSLGLTLRGGVPNDPQGGSPGPGKPLVVTHVRPGGPAHRSGRLKVGDRILSIDAHPLSNKSLLDAEQLLRGGPGDGLAATASLRVEFEAGALGGMRAAGGPLLVELGRRPGPLGLALGDRHPSVGMAPRAVYVHGIQTASTADRCGALEIGDQILAVDDTYIEGTSVTPEEVLWLLDNYDVSEGVTRLQIMPNHVLTNGNHGSSTEWVHRGLGPPSSPSTSTLSTLSRRPRGNVPPGPTLGHVEILTVALRAGTSGYGLLVGQDGDAQRHNVLVTQVVPDSPAYRCGSLQVGDRIISVNGQCSLSLQEVRCILDAASSGSRLLLQTEFDVADAVVPASGVFTVKIARNGVDLGITITASKTIPDDPFIISEIRRGSPAHRTGTLHVGDRILAVDSRPLDQVLDSNCLDQAEVVTLRVQKIDESLRPPQPPEPPEEIVYTVELNRRGGPLGITVSGSEDRTEPIVLSALTQGGLAEKTGALHVGDRILAINGENLEQRPLSDAIRLLQTSGDKIQIKIARHIKSNNEDQLDTRVNYSSPGLTSIDSAVESWDSSMLEPPMDTIQTYDPSKHPDPHPEVPTFTSFHQNNSYSDLVTFRKKPDDREEVESTIEVHSSMDGQPNHPRSSSQILFYSDVEDSLCPSPLPLPNYNFTNTLPKYGSYFFCNKNMGSRDFNNYSKEDRETYSSSPLPDVEIHYVTLHKDSVYDDYGFSVSDGLYSRGVYINRIRRGGPAHLAGVLKPYDRILQVNDTKTKDFDCCLTVPLIASAGDKIELVIARNPYIGCPDEKDMHVLSWTPEEQDLPRISSKSFSSSQNTITKTL